MNETLEIGGLAFEVRRSDRRRTLGLTVDRDGDLVMHAPLGASAEELAAWAGTKLLWVHRKLALKEESTPKASAPEYVTGETFSFLGRRYRLVLVHELCHLVEPSHNREFWRSLERALPDWQDRKAELHRGTADLFWCAPAMRQ